MASKQSIVLVLAAVAACLLLLLPAASAATSVEYCSEYPRPFLQHLVGGFCGFARAGLESVLQLVISLAVPCR
jgi:hypothetical protein